jgi:Uma2 family endonuclease
MGASAIQKNKELGNNTKPKPISWDAFKNSYLKKEDKYKYEWVDGYVEKTLRNMDKNQFFIQFNLQTFLLTLKVDGLFIAEGDTFFAKKHRRPDIAYYTKEQIRLAQDEKNTVVPKFVIEIISNNDQMNRVVKKMQNYREAEVSVIWHIFPLDGEIHVYKGKNMTICTGDDICSAEPVLPQFCISVKQILKKL